jgi:uncharacterized protein YkwD
VVLVLALVAGSLPAAAVATPSTCGAGAPRVDKRAEARLAVMINRVRMAAGADRLTRRRGLAAHARRRSWQISASQALVHELPPRGANRMIGQNIAIAPTPASALQAMLQSPRHRSNLLSRQFRAQGVGIVRGCDGWLAMTIDFVG